MGGVAVFGVVFVVFTVVFGELSPGLTVEVGSDEVVVSLVVVGLSPPHEQDAVTISVVTINRRVSEKSSVRFMECSFLGKQ